MKASVIIKLQPYNIIMLFGILYPLDVNCYADVFNIFGFVLFYCHCYGDDKIDRCPRYPIYVVLYQCRGLSHYWDLQQCWATASTRTTQRETAYVLHSLTCVQCEQYSALQWPPQQGRPAHPSPRTCAQVSLSSNDCHKHLLTMQHTNNA